MKNVVLTLVRSFGVVAVLFAGGFASSGLISAAGTTVPPRVVSAAAGDGFAQVTIADMSPDSGVYAVQWVPQGESFNSYQMFRTTSKTMTVPHLACTRSYTFQVL
jgi:hypothetical protein